jgi:hypothetical protein
MEAWWSGNVEMIGGVVVAVGGIAVAVWQKLLAMRTERAKAGADVAIAESQREVYELMKERLASLSADLDKTDAKVDVLIETVRERNHKIFALELYVRDLQRELQKHGIDVPEMRE